MAFYLWKEPENTQKMEESSGIVFPKAFRV